MIFQAPKFFFIRKRKDGKFSTSQAQHKEIICISWSYVIPVLKGALITELLGGHSKTQTADCADYADYADWFFFL